MKFKTIQPFICRFTGVRYDIEDFFESNDPERIKELQIKGFLDTVEAPKEEAKVTGPKKSSKKKVSGVNAD